MRMEIVRDDFFRAFREAGREKQFSPAGLSALYDYLIELEGQTGEEIELDVIGLCCEYTEYDNFQEVQQAYNDIEPLALEDLTTVIKLDGGGLILRAF